MWKNSIMLTLILLLIVLIARNFNAFEEYETAKYQVNSWKGRRANVGKNEISAQADRIEFTKNTQHLYLQYTRSGYPTDAAFEEVFGSPRINAYGNIQWYHD